VQPAGIDPVQLAAVAAQLSSMVAAQQAPSITFGALFNLYYDLHAVPKTKRPDNARHFYNRHGRAWKAVPVNAITPEAVQRWVDDIGATRGTYGANRALNLMEAVFNWGIRRRHISCPNPCVGIERFKEKSRDRFALPAELQRLADALQREPAIWRDYVWLSLFTGARRGNVLAMRWQDVDFDLLTWRIPETKNGQSLTVALTDWAVVLLKRRKSEADPTSPWVFPGTGRTGHIAEPKRMWRRVCNRAGIDDLRIHDLRRTLGSWMAIQGASTIQIAKALGHLDQRSTAVYARLDLTAVRNEVTKATARMLACCVEQPPVIEVKAIECAATVGGDVQPKTPNAGKLMVAKSTIYKAIQRIDALHERGATKKEIWCHVDLKAPELDGILNELCNEGIIIRYRDERNLRSPCWRWKLA
jgi:integrase